MKRTDRGGGQGRLLGIGDGTGIVSGKLVALNNTFVTSFPRDFYLFTERTSIGDAILLNNIFAGPGQRFLDRNGKGAVIGARNWIANAAGLLPDTLTDSLRGNDPGFVDAKASDFRLRPDSPVIGKGLSPEEYLNAIRVVTDNARSGSDAKPSPARLRALEEVEKTSPAFVPVKKGHGYEPQAAPMPFEPGAFQFTPAGR